MKIEPEIIRQRIASMRDTIEYCRSLIASYNDEIRFLQKQCEHKFPKYSGLSCEICGSKTYTGGWYCPNSPDNRCYYRTNDHNLVKLNDGQIVKPGIYWPGKEYENEDTCVFCGQPEERK